MSPAEFQARASREGRDAQRIARSVLQGSGFTIRAENHRLPVLGITVNFEAVDPSDMTWYFDVSGAFTTRRGGLLRTDTLYKTLGRAAVLASAGLTPVVLLTTNVPTRGSAGDKALRAVGTALVFDVIEMVTTDGRARLCQYGIGNAHHCPLPGFWTAQDLYGDSLQGSGTQGEALSVPFNLTNDPFGDLSESFQISDLPHRIRVYLPSRTRKGHAVRSEVRSAVGARIQQILSEECGGCTSQEAHGHWVDPLGGVAYEDVQVIESYSPEVPSRSTLQEVIELILRDLDQEAAAIVLGERMMQFTERASFAR
jgi:hypothetical protein